MTTRYCSSGQRGIALPAILLLGVVVLVALGVGVYLTSRKPAATPAPTAPEATTQTTTATQRPTTTKRPSATPAPTAAKTMETFTSTEFSINYPLDWQVLNSQIPDGRSILLRPISGSVFYPKFIIESVAPSNRTVQQKVDDFVKLQFSQQPTTIAGMPATKVSNLWAPPAIPEQIMTVFYIFSANGKTYTVGYEYEAATPKPAEEAIYQQMIQSMKFNNVTTPTNSGSNNLLR